MHIFIFRRDFRLFDNTGLILCCERAIATRSQVLPIFIFSPNQIDPAKNSYFNPKCVRFMLECIKSLQAELKAVGGQLFCFEGETIQILDEIRSQHVIESVTWNMDVTPFAKQRDAEVVAWAREHKLDYNSPEDYTLHRLRNSKAFTVCSHLKSYSQRDLVALPRKASLGTDLFLAGPINGSLTDDRIDSYAPSHEKGVDIYGGRFQALKIVSRIKQGHFKDYKFVRNSPSKQKTTLLASYIKFGCVSIREVYHAVLGTNGKGDKLMSEVYWREFYAHLAYHHPQLLAKQISQNPNAPLQSQKPRIWVPAEGDTWNAWCQGK